MPTALSLSGNTIIINSTRLPKNSIYCAYGGDQLEIRNLYTEKVLVPRQSYSEYTNATGTAYASLAALIVVTDSFNAPLI